VLSQPEAGLGYPGLSSDDRWLVYVRTLVRADVWTLSSGSRAEPGRPAEAATR
jgi:hypothetical protein